MLIYKGYYTNPEYSKDDKLWHGTLLGINDLVNYHSIKEEDILKEFQSAVDDYLEFCKEIGKEPEIPVSTDYANV